MERIFLVLCAIHAPLKLNRTSLTKSPQITTVLKKRMTFRDRLKKKAIKTQNMSIWNEFREVKNRLNQEMKAAYYTTTPITNILVTNA